MLNKVNHRYIEGLVPLENNGGKFIGIKNNELVAQTTSDLLYNIDVAPIQPFCLNSCAENFIHPYGVVTNEDKLTISPITLKDSTNTIDIELKESITKSIEGLFEEGNDVGCKDDSYVKWKQPIMNSNSTMLARMSYIGGTNITEPYHLMDGILNSEDNCWLATISSEIDIIFQSKIPFITESVILVNTFNSNRTRNIDLSAFNGMLVENYFCNADANAQNYINIPRENRIEDDELILVVKSAFVGNTVGFNEMIINAKTRYIQQNSKYNVFLITNEDQSKVDILVSSLKEPILPNEFTYYAFIKEIETKNDAVLFKSSLGNDINFNTSLSAKITNAKNETAYLDNINYIHFDEENSQSIVKYTIYLKLDGTAYIKDTEYYKNASDFPLTPNVGDVVGYTKNANLEAYEWDGETWIEFNDVPVGEVYRYQNRILYINQFPCNNNFYVKCIDNNIWKEEDLYIPNKTYEYVHNLNIQDTSVYNCDCLAICIENDSDYVVGDMALVTSQFKPFLSKNKIGLRIETIQAINKAHNSISLSENKWKLVFRIWR